MRILEALRPFDLDGTIKTRAGRNGDGGYIIGSDFNDVGAVYSFGIGGDVSFDLDFSAAGIPVYQFDHTVDAPPNPHGNFHFQRRGITAVADGANEFATLSQFLEANGHSCRRDLLLKLDVEGAEVDVLRTADSATLFCFRQVVVELHWLARVEDDGYRASILGALEKLNSSFTLFHVHANNHADLHIVDGFVIADVLELTYVRSDLAKPMPSRTVYPTQIDFPNHVGKPDHLLWFYPFLPSTESVYDTDKYRCSLCSAVRSLLEDERKSLKLELTRLRHEADVVTDRLDTLELGKRVL
jgi:hypothetical protein